MLSKTYFFSLSIRLHGYLDLYVVVVTRETPVEIDDGLLVQARRACRASDDCCARSLLRVGAGLGDKRPSHSECS